jgi:hypothetical protein
MAGTIEPTAQPVGTPDSIHAYGESPLKWGSCAEVNSIHPKFGGPIAGCPFHADCVFKKDRPRNCGVYVEIDSGANQQFISSCFGYMSGLHSRAMQQDKTGEVIAIIADEGEMIEETIRLSADPVNCNKNGNMALKEVVRQVVVPAFPQPGEEGSALSPKMKDTRSFAKRMIEMKRQQHIDKKLGIARTEGVEDISSLIDTEPTAAPAKRGPGRPKKFIDPGELGS